MPRMRGDRVRAVDVQIDIEAILNRRPAMRARLAARTPVIERDAPSGSLADWLRVCADVARGMEREL